MSSGEKPPERGRGRPLSGGPIRFGPFWLEQRLAVGGTAEVYVARPVDPYARPARLVVKRLLPQYVSDAEGRTMFERESALHAAVHHENVVEVFGFGYEGEEPWLAMEYVDGCDLFRLLRRLSAENRTVPVSLAVYIARELLRALDSVHTARDASGQPMGIIHRDVTPSNVYLSIDGRVKLGDFGIARTATRATLRPGATSAMLKGKFAYLSPEQVASDPFDHRADLFALGAVLSEMVIGQQLFGGSGQLAVLLAIRDCRIEPLREVRPKLPPGLFEVLERTLTRDPATRIPTAAALRRELEPFDANPVSAKAELCALVRWVQTVPSVEQMHAIRESVAKLRPRPMASDSFPGDERTTGEYNTIPSFVVTGTGRRLGPWTFARLVESIATGEISRGDMVDYMGRGFRALEAIEELARFLPSMTTATTNRLAGVSSPDFSDDVSPGALVNVLARVVESEATGVLFAEGITESRRTPTAGGPREYGRKELYFVGGRLHHVSSNNASELLGEFLVRRKIISREELDFALAVLPRYNGRMGDTLIALGLVGSLEIFRAIRDQGRDRLVDLFQWQAGKLSYYSGQTAPHVDFPLDLDIPALLIAGIEAASPGDTPIAAWRPRLEALLSPVAIKRPKMRAASWSPVIRVVLETVIGPTSVRDLLGAATHEGMGTASDVLRAVEVLLGANLLTINVSQPS
jgi:eukaryotic-like serine/threonine-protein kinase